MEATGFRMTTLAYFPAPDFRKERPPTSTHFKVEALLIRIFSNLIESTKRIRAEEFKSLESLRVIRYFKQVPDWNIVFSWNSGSLKLIRLNHY